jgi:heterodisulfide reductase subunit A
MMDAGRHPNITLLSYSEVEEVSGYVGNFTVKVRRKPRYVIEELCTGCGACVEACVWKERVPSEFEAGMGKRNAIYIPFGQAIPLIAVVDDQSCLFLTRGKCNQKCAAACERNAIDFEQKEEFVELDVGTIIVATGFQMFDAARLPEYNYGKSPNIIDGLQFERLSSATGPTGGEILTAEGEVPERVAIIHCVGSRDERANRYCSRVCCMYAMKHAHLVRDKTGAEVYEFYMDIRAFGKGYEEFYERVQDEGVFFIRGRGAEVVVEPDGKLNVKAEDANLGCMVEAKVDMVVLETGLVPQPDTDRMGAIFGLSRSEDGFFLEAHPKLRPVETNTDGVFLAGACQAPRDVPDTVAHANAAAAEALALLSQGVVQIAPTTAEVNEELCSGCGECVLVCPYSAISLTDHTAQINSALCKGCGTCAAACLAKAITALHFTNEQIVAQIEGVLA